ARPGDGEPGGGPTIFRAPATIWIQSGLRLGGSFQARVVTSGVTLADADFAAAPEAARGEINRVIAEQTEGKLTGLMPSGTVAAPFGGDADFSEITADAQLRIGAVAHKAYIDVDEQGTEAAAATAVVMRAAAAMRPPPLVTMVVDRPFLFVIIDTETGLPVFLG